MGAIPVGAEDMNDTGGPVHFPGNQRFDVLANHNGAEGHGRGRDRGGGGDHDVGVRGIQCVYVAVFALAVFAAVTSLNVGKVEANFAAVRSSLERVEESLQELKAEMSTFKERQDATGVLAQEQIRAMEAQSKALQALRAELSQTQQDVKAQLNEVTKKHADTHMIAELALGHLAGHVPEVAKHIGGDKLHAALAQLRSEDSSQRCSAVRALGQSGGSSCAAGAVARKALVAALRGDSKWRVRLEAATNLGLLPDATSVPSLTAALREDRDDNVRQEAAKALGLIGAPAALTAVEDLTSAMRKDSFKGVGAAAAGALLALGAEEPTFAEAQGIALQILHNSTWVRERRTAAWAVGRGGGAEARAALEKASSGDGDRSVRAEASKALETLRP